MRDHQIPNESLGYWLARHTELHRDRESIVYWHSEEVCERWSYGEIDAAARRLAVWMHQNGVTAGDCVAFHDFNDARFVVTMFAAAYLGAIFVPLNFRLAAPELIQTLEDCRPSLVVHGQAFSAVLPQLRAALPGVQTLLSSREEGGEYDRIILDDRPAPAIEIAQVHWSETAWLLYTSGSTARPKGVMLSHGNLFWNTLNTMLIQGGFPSDRMLISAPLFHAAPVSSFLEVFLRGATIHLERAFDAARVLARIAHERIEVMAGVPAMYAMLAAHPQFSDAQLSTLRGIIVGGSPVPEALIKSYRQRGITVIQRYGLTEAAPLITGLSPDAPPSKSTTAGLPGFFLQMRIAAADPEGVGEIQTRGANVMQGYWGRPEETAAAFDGDWLKTGDLGKLDDDGYLHVVGRRKDMIISGGENVYAAEVEASLSEAPGVLEAAVIGVPHATWGETVWAIVAPKQGAHLTSDLLLAHLQGRLARYKQPTRIFVLSELPKNGAGKIDKMTLRRQYAAAASEGM